MIRQTSTHSSVYGTNPLERGWSFSLLGLRQVSGGEQEWADWLVLGLLLECCRVLWSFYLWMRVPVPTSWWMGPDVCLHLCTKLQHRVPALFGVPGGWGSWGVPKGTPSNNSIILLGAFSDHMGNDSVTCNGIIRRNCLPDLNSSGVQLLDLFGSHSLSITNTMLNHKGLNHFTQDSLQVHLCPWAVGSDWKSKVPNTSNWNEHPSQGG